MTEKRLREIAALEVELAMTEAHAQKLSAMALGSINSGEEDRLAPLLKDERDRAETLRQKIRVLKSCA